MRVILFFRNCIGAHARRREFSQYGRNSTARHGSIAITRAKSRSAERKQKTILQQTAFPAKPSLRCRLKSIRSSPAVIERLATLDTGSCRPRDVDISAASDVGRVDDDGGEVCVLVAPRETEGDVALPRRHLPCLLQRRSDRRRLGVVEASSTSKTSKQRCCR